MARSDPRHDWWTGLWVALTMCGMIMLCIVMDWRGAPVPSDDA